FEAIGAHGGVVNQMIGDGLMAVFGAPLPLRDPCASAVAAALAMTAGIAPFNAARAQAGKPPIAFGIGIASGEMVAGYTGTTQRATYTCIGDTVNLAARLETHTRAAQCAILIDSATCRALGAGHATAALGPVRFKGKAESVEVYAIAVP
ncbi:MAG: adenylate/guanylate cyclase domain-containing protein, partial [Burkholderiaceae bacterium]